MVSFTNLRLWSPRLQTCWTEKFRASLLGLGRPFTTTSALTSSKWSQTETDRLTQLLQQQKMALQFQHHFPGRTPQAVQRKASLLRKTLDNFRSISCRRWSATEAETLRRGVAAGLMPSEMVAMIPTRSRIQIKAARDRLLSMEGARRDNETISEHESREIFCLRDVCRMTWKEIALQLQRSTNQLRRHYGLYKRHDATQTIRNRQLSNEEVSILRNLWAAGATTSQIAKQLDRAVSVVNGILGELRFKGVDVPAARMFKWSQQEDECLMDWIRAGATVRKLCAEFPSRTYSAIQKRRSLMSKRMRAENPTLGDLAPMRQQKWTTDEEARLVKGVGEGKSWLTLAIELQRSEVGVCSKYRRLQEVRPPKEELAEDSSIHSRAPALTIISQEE